MNAVTLLIAVRFALYLDLMLIFGLPLFALYTMRGDEQRAGCSAISSGRAFALSLAGALLSVFGLLLLAATMSDVPITQVDRETIDALVNQTVAGTAGKIRVAVLLFGMVAAGLLRTRPRILWPILTILGAVALGSLAWTGHGAADEGSAGQIHPAADIAHLLAAGIWIGALAGLSMLVFRARRATNDQHARVALAHHGLALFSMIGTLAVAAIILTGLVNSWYLVGIGNIWSLAGSLYGRLLILKLFIFAGMLGLAGLHRFRFTPAIEFSLREGNALSDLRAISRSVALESGFALVVLGLVAWLGTLAPPVAS